MKEFKHGKTTLLNCDCMEYMAGLEDNAFDLAVVDPPYGTGMSRERPRKDGRFAHNKSSAWDDCIPKDEYFNELKRVSVNQIIFGGNYFNLGPCRGFIFWYKRNPVPNFSDGEMAWTSFDTVAKCFDYQYYGALDGKNLAAKKMHISQKPIALYKWIFANYAKPGQRILDTHGGSFSSAIAAHYAGLEFVGMELDPDHYTAAVERFKKETRQIDIFQT